MNFLAPLYALAALGIVVPVVLHLVRKQPKEKLEFSSLLFLTASPQRLTRKSQIDQWLLLLLRAGILVLLALAFARPYWTSAVEANGRSQLATRRIVLVDQSASMRRPGLWDAALADARKAIQESHPDDVVAVYGYADALTPILSVSSANDLPVGKRVETATAGLNTLELSWGGSQLGKALHECIDLLQADQVRSDDQSVAPSEIVVVSDLQASTEIASLSQLEWPTETSLRVLRVGTSASSNAHFSFLARDSDFEPDASTPDKAPPVNANLTKQESKPDESWRIRVTNEAGSKREAFQLKWLDPSGQGIDSTTTECRVAEGTARVVRLPPPPAHAIALELSGDEGAFDNRRYLVTDPPRTLTVRCIDVVPNKPEESLWYFLSRIPLDSTSQSVLIERLTPGDLWSAAQVAKEPWLIASHHLPDSDADRCREFLEAGGHMLWVWDAPADGKSPDGQNFVDRYMELTKRCTAVDLGRISEANVKEYALLSRIDFQSPIFAPLSGSQFNDFSRVRFWKHRQISFTKPEDWRVLAWFDDDSPAFIERPVGKGKLCILTAGWQPIESQLALSSKFVPLMSSLFAQACPVRESMPEWIVGQRYPVPHGVEVRDANGSGIHASNSESSEPNAWVTVSTPGIYERQLSEIDRTRFAANVSPPESITTALDLAEFNRFGVRLTPSVESSQQSSKAKQQMVATEIESKQSGWWWLISAALFAVGIESILGIRRKPITRQIV